LAARVDPVHLKDQSGEIERDTHGGPADEGRAGSEDRDCRGALASSKRHRNAADVSIGSKATVRRCSRYFRFAPESRHSSEGSACLKSANSGHSWEPQSPPPDRRPIGSSGGTSCFSGASGGVECSCTRSGTCRNPRSGRRAKHWSIGRHTLKRPTLFSVSHHHSP
jgi:hypothetical protein